MTSSSSNRSETGAELELSVVIPTFKESARLPQTLSEIVPYLDEHHPSHEILVVDDNSPDGTGQIVKDWALRHPKLKLLVQPGRHGKGAAVRRGCLESRGRFVLFMDADHSTPIHELEDFFPAIGNAGAVVGVRTYQEDESRGRRVIGLIAQLLAHLIVFRKAVVDSQCGFKMFTKDAVQRIFPFARVDGGMLDVELFYLMHKFGVSCRYVPVTWANKPGSRINVLACMVRDPVDMLRIRIRDLAGVYAKPIAKSAQPWRTAK